MNTTNTTTITDVLRAAAGMIEIERAAFVGCQAWPDGSLRGSDVEICQQYDKVLGMLRDALDAVQREPGYHTHWTPHPVVPKETEPREQGRARLTADVVEQRLLTWRQRFVNRSGDQLALDDFMDRQSIDDLVDFVCDEVWWEKK